MTSAVSRPGRAAARPAAPRSAPAPDGPAPERAGGDGWRAPESFRILGSRVHRVGNEQVLDAMTHWIEEERDRCHFIVNTGFHGLWVAHRDPAFKAIVNTADLFSPDGIAPIWLSRLRRMPLEDRATSAELMKMFFARAQAKGWRSYFMGDTDETLAALKTELERQYPGHVVAGTFSPPFRPPTPEEERALIDRINAARPDVVWVGLGLPKQERWIARHREALDAPVAIGVGACFGFFSGRVSRAPLWVGRMGLEWLWRFSQEPKKLWRRVLVEGPGFVFHAALELTGLRKYE